jgi:hypothetical protein
VVTNNVVSDVFISTTGCEKLNKVFKVIPLISKIVFDEFTAYILDAETMTDSKFPVVIELHN